MYQVPLTQQANQAIAFNQDGAYWRVRVFQSINFMCADIYRNNVPVILGVRCFGGVPLMPYDYMWKPNFGNFVFDKDADYTEFGESCSLYYLSESELDTYLAAIEAVEV